MLETRLGGAVGERRWRQPNRGYCYASLLSEQTESLPPQRRASPALQTLGFLLGALSVATLVLLGLRKGPTPLRSDLRPSVRSTAEGDLFAFPVMSAFMQGHLEANQNLPVNWTVRYVENVPVLFKDKGADNAHNRSLVWVVKLWPAAKPLAHAQKQESTSNLMHEALRVWSNGTKVLFQGQPSKGGLPMFAIRANLSEVQGFLRRSHGIEFVEQDSEMYQIADLDVKEGTADFDYSKTRSSETPSSKQDDPPSWGLDRIDQRGAVNASKPGSYRYRPKAGERVHVYVVDSGIRTSHRDFGGRAVPTLEVNDGGVVQCRMTDEDCAMDTLGHGTRLAAPVGGFRYGVAKQTTLHAVKVLDDQGRTSTWRLLAAFDWLLRNAEQPAVVLLAVAREGQLSAMSVAAEAAKNAGITVVNAAGMHGTGNVGPDACHHTPSYLQDVITVGATTRDDARANFSQVGQCVDLLAPGAAVRSAGISSDHAETTLSGTSPAAAYAAGAAALLLAEKPDLSPEEVKQALIRRATVGRVSNLGGAPDRLVNSLGGVPKVPNWAEEPEGMWSLVDGGVDRECGGEDDDHAAHYDFEVFTKVKTLEDCKQRCQSAASTMGCAGISYSEEEEKCEVWVQLVRSSVEMTGYLCLRHEAPTKTSTSRTSTSQTTQTRTTTSVTTVTSVTSTRTTTTHTQPPLLSDVWSSRKDLNCLVSAGGAQTASGRDYLGVLPKEACIKECAHQKGCDAALIQDFGRVGNCWLRSNVFLDHCSRAPGFTVWTRNPLTLRMKK